MKKANSALDKKFLLRKMETALIASSIIALTSCDTFLFGPMATYHKPVMVCTQPARIISDGKNVYEWDFGGRWLTKINEKQVANRFYYPNLRNKRDINCIDTFGETFVFSTSQDSSINDCKIIALDKNMRLQKQVDSVDYIKSLVCFNNSIYCLCGWDDFFIKKYSIDSFEETHLCEKIETKQMFQDGEVRLYVNQLCDLCVVGANTRYTCSDEAIDCWHNDYGVIECLINDNRLCVIQNGEEKVFSLPFEDQFFYNYAYIDGNYLIAAVREYVENDQCPPLVKRCFCHFGRSSILRYDLKKQTFLEPINYENQTILIDYDFDGAQYYFDGALYDHNIKTRDCQKIEIKGTIKISISEWLYVPKDDERLWLLYYKTIFNGI